MNTKTIIKNAKIYDGSGSRPFFADVLIENGIIKKIGAIVDEPECHIVDAAGMILTPGFINTHSHAELELFENPRLLQIVGQGITTEVLGQDGSSVTPIDDAHVAELAESMVPLCEIGRASCWVRV